MIVFCEECKFSDWDEYGDRGGSGWICTKTQALHPIYRDRPALCKLCWDVNKNNKCKMFEAKNENRPK
jgi:hypothetical protein